MSLTAQHIAAQKRLQDGAAAHVGRAWRLLGAYNRADVAVFQRLALPVVLGAQRSSALLTNAYIAKSARRSLPPIDLGLLTGAAIRNGTTPTEVYFRPFVTVWTALKAGSPFADAVSAGLARATSSAAMDVALSMRATMTEREGDLAPYGYRRVADPGACDFCLEVDGAYIKGADGFPMALHNHCGCGFDVLDQPHRGAVSLPDGTRIRAYQYGPLNEHVAVQDHGELGPVLTDPSQHFAAL